MFGADDGVDSTANRPVRLDLHPRRRAARDQIVQDHVGDVLVIDAFCAVPLQIELQTLQLDARGGRNVRELDPRKIRLAGLRADAGEFMYVVFDKIGAVRVRIGKRFEPCGVGHDSRSIREQAG